MDIEERLKQKIKKEEKVSIIIGSVICAVLCMLIILAFIERVTEVKKGNTETGIWLNFGIIAMLICLVAVFVKYILCVYIDSKKEDVLKYEKIKIVALRVRIKTTIYGTWRSNALVENLETGEQFMIEQCGDMKENEKYYMLRAKNSKIFAYEPLEEGLQRN